jgi:hypothetical protein
MKTIKTALAFSALLVATAPALASGGDYDSLWPNHVQSQSQAVVQEGRSSVSEPQTRAVTGEEIDHLKAPIYNYVRQQ